MEKWLLMGWGWLKEYSLSIMRPKGGVVVDEEIIRLLPAIGQLPFQLPRSP